MQNKSIRLVFQKKDITLGVEYLRTAYVDYTNGTVKLSGYIEHLVGVHEAYPPQTIACAREIFEDLNYTEIDTLENLRAFILSGPFMIRKIEQDLNLTRGTITDFLKKTYSDRHGNVLKTGLGVHEDKVFEYMKRYGYKEDVAYEQFL